MCVCVCMQGTVFGRVDVIRSLNVRLDYLKITTAVYDFPTGYGCIKIAFCGLPMNMTMGNVLVTNNEVYGETCLRTSVQHATVKGTPTSPFHAVFRPCRSRRSLFYDIPQMRVCHEQ